MYAALGVPLYFSPPFIFIVQQRFKKVKIIYLYQITIFYYNIMMYFSLDMFVFKNSVFLLTEAITTAPAHISKHHYCLIATTTEIYYFGNQSIVVA